MRLALRKVAAAKLGVTLKREPGDKPPIPLDFGLLTDLDQAIEDWSAWNKSGHVVMAIGGGWWDQPETWRHNVTTIEAVFNEEYARLSKERDKKPR